MKRAFFGWKQALLVFSFLTLSSTFYGCSGSSSGSTSAEIDGSIDDSEEEDGDSSSVSTEEDDDDSSTSNNDSTSSSLSFLSLPMGFAVESDNRLVTDQNGNFFLSSVRLDRITKITSNGTISVFADGSDGVIDPADLLVQSDGSLLVSNPSRNTVLNIALDGSIRTIADVNDGLSSPQGLVLDESGTLFIASLDNSSIYKVTSTGTISLVADETEGLKAPHYLAVDSVGNLYANNSSHQIFKVTSAGDVSIIADSSDGLSNPTKMVVDKDENLFVIDTNNAFKIDQQGSVSRILDAADGLRPQDIDIDSSGNIFITSYKNDKLFKITSGGAVTTLSEGLTTPINVVVNSRDEVFITTLDDDRLSKVSLSGALSLVADGTSGIVWISGLASASNGSLALSSYDNAKVFSIAPDGSSYVIADSSDGLEFPEHLLFDDIGRLLIQDNDELWALSSGGQLSLLADSTDGLDNPGRFVLDDEGTIFIVDSYDVSKIDTAGTVNVLARLGSPEDLLIDQDGNVVVTDKSNAKVTTITPEGTVTGEDDMELPTMITMTTTGNLFVTCTDEGGQSYISKISSEGEVTRSITTKYGLGRVSDMITGEADRIFIADSRDHEIIAIDADGEVSVLVNANDGIYSPRRLAINEQGQLIINMGNSQIAILQL